MNKCVLSENTLWMCHALSKVAKINTLSGPLNEGLYYTQFMKKNCREPDIAVITLDHYLCIYCPFCGEKIYKEDKHTFHNSNIHFRET